MASGQRHQTKLTPLYTSEKKEEMRKSPSSPRCKCALESHLWSNKNYFNTVYIWGFLGDLHLYQTFSIQWFPASLLGLCHWLGWWALVIFQLVHPWAVLQRFPGLFSGPFFPRPFPSPFQVIFLISISYFSCYQLFHLMSAAPKIEDFSQTSVMTWEKQSCWTDSSRWSYSSLTPYFHFHINFFQTNKMLTVSKIPFFWL